MLVQVRKLEQKQRERDSTPVVDEPREMVESSRQPFHQRDKPPEPDLPEPIDMFADDDADGNTGRDVFSKRLSSSPARPAEPGHVAVGDNRENVQDMLSLTPSGGGQDQSNSNKNVRFEVGGGGSEPVTPSPGHTPLSDEEDGPGASNAPSLPAIETQLKPSPVKPVSAPSPYARAPGFSGVPPPLHNGNEPADLLPAAQLPKSLLLGSTTTTTPAGAVPPPPLPPGALHEMQQISQLLNAQQRLAAPGSSRPRVDLFKPPAPYGTSTGSNSSGTALDRKSRSSGSAGAYDNIDITDMDVASPTSDDDLIGSFTPPLGADDAGAGNAARDPREDRKSRKQRHADRKRKAAAGKTFKHFLISN